VNRLQDIWYEQWGTVAASFLAGGVLAATLLIYRVLGYRLCRPAAAVALSNHAAEAANPPSSPSPQFD